MKLLIALCALVPLLAGCPLVHDDPAPQACRTDVDCFVDAGEYCDRPDPELDGICRVRHRDAGKPDRGPLPDGPPLPDVGSDLDAGPGPDLDTGPGPDSDASGDLPLLDQGGE